MAFLSSLAGRNSSLPSTFPLNWISCDRCVGAMVIMLRLLMFLFACMQPLSVWKFILLTSLPTVGASGFIAGTQLAKRNLEVFVMAISKFLFPMELLYLMMIISMDMHQSFETWFEIYFLTHWHCVSYTQHSWAVCHHHVWCDCKIDLQECSNMASWPLQVSKSGSKVLLCASCWLYPSFFVVYANLSTP